MGSIEGDRHKLLQVVVQLLANARQALEGCDVRRIRVTSMRSDAEGIAIEVSDTGCGIPAENRMRIFNHGFTTRRNGNGFGLHASACAAVEMRGRLTAHSDGPGRGACFRIELPRSPGHGPSTGAHHVESTPAL